jgi:hypothetical protein
MYISIHVSSITPQPSPSSSFTFLYAFDPYLTEYVKVRIHTNINIYSMYIYIHKNTPKTAKPGSRFLCIYIYTYMHIDMYLH